MIWTLKIKWTAHMMEERIAKVETTIERQSGQIHKLFSRNDETNKCIIKINNSMLQIKWSVYGAFGFFVATQVGILKALKLVL